MLTKFRLLPTDSLTESIECAGMWLGLCQQQSVRGTGSKLVRFINVDICGEQFMLKLKVYKIAMKRDRHLQL